MFLNAHLSTVVIYWLAEVEWYEFYLLELVAENSFGSIREWSP